MLRRFKSDLDEIWQRCDIVFVIKLLKLLRYYRRWFCGHTKI